MDEIKDAASLIREASYLGAFTGAGISVESGIPPFRGEDGIWKRHAPELFDISYFSANPLESWTLLKQLFFETFKNARPNEAHEVLARLEEKGVLKTLITQNIDNLHFLAGSRNIVEYHGNTRTLICMQCRKTKDAHPDILEHLPPRCGCGGILKPDIVFFGEEIPVHAVVGVEKALARADVLLVIGTTGEVYPAALIPIEAKRQGIKIIEVNIEPSSFTYEVSDIFLRGKASRILSEIEIALEDSLPSG